MDHTIALREYWEKRFSKDQLIWGLEPSRGAKEFVRPEVAHGAPLRILDLGCGYARDARYFTDHGHDVVGIDISEEGIKIAQRLNPGACFQVMDACRLSFPDESFDAVFGNFLLHLFSDRSLRDRVIAESYRVLRTPGEAVFTIASVEDADFGKGEAVARNLFKNERGVLKYYYDLQAVQEEFARFPQVRVRSLSEEHTHDTPHTHVSYLVVARKP